MSQQLILDLSDSATARSKGQARRRNQPAQSEDARKAQRNLARRERARCKKTGNTEQQRLHSVQPSPYADQPQYGASLPVKDKAAQKNLELPLVPHLPAFTVLPAHADDINLRALAQSSRYIAAQAKARETKDIVRDDVQQIGDGNKMPAQDQSNPHFIVEGQDLDAVEILAKAANEQHLISTATHAETMSVDTGDETEAEAVMEYSQKCPVTTCEYHHKGFSLKVERDKHTMTQFQGDVRCSIWSSCGSSSDYSNTYLNNVEHLRNHIRIFYGRVPLTHHITATLKCWICHRSFLQPAYLEHLDDCILHAVELEASEKAGTCPVPYCVHHHKDFSSKYQREQHVIQHYGYNGKAFEDLTAVRL